MDHDISIGFLFKILKKNWWKLLIVTVAAAVLMTLFASYGIRKKYSSTVEFYIININTSYDYTTSSLLSATAQLSNDYISIIKSDYMLEQVKEGLKEKGYTVDALSYDTLRSMLHSKTEPETSVFSIRVVHTSPRVAYDIATTIAEIAPAAVTELAKPDSLTHESLADKVHTVLNYYNNHLEEGQAPVQLTEKEIANMLHEGFIGITTRQDCIRVINEPLEATSHDSPNELTYGMIGAVAALVIGYVALLIRALFEQRITTEEDLRKLVNRPVIGAIPHWDAPAKKEGGAK